MGEGPVGDFDESGDGLRGLGLEGGVEQRAGNNKYLGGGGERETVEVGLSVFSDEDGGDVKAGAKGLFEEVVTFNGGETSGFAAGLEEGAAQFLEACVLLALNEAMRHGDEISH
jgi:hypothetical protein